MSGLILSYSKDKPVLFKLGDVAPSLRYERQVLTVQVISFFRMQSAEAILGGELSEQEYRKLTSKPHLKHNDMTAELCNEAVEIITMACDKHAPQKNYEAAAQLIKQSMDKKFGTFWHCIIGEGYGFDISYQQRHVLYLYTGEIGVLVYKC